MPRPNRRNSTSRVTSTPVNTWVYLTSLNHSQSVHASTTRSSSVNSRNTMARTMTVIRPRRLTLFKGVRITTVDSTRSHVERHPAVGGMRFPGQRSTLRAGPRISARRRRLFSAWAQLGCASVPQGLQRLQRLVERTDLDQLDAGLRVGDRLGAVRVGRQEDRGPGLLGGDQFLRDAADRPDLALIVDGAGASDDLAAGEVFRGELVEYA